MQILRTFTLQIVGNADLRSLREEYGVRNMPATGDSD